MEKKIISQSFWIRTPTALVLKKTITPEEYLYIESIEQIYEDGSRGIIETDKGRIINKK